MIRCLRGGFLTLSGVVGIVGIIIAAMQNPSTQWVTPPGRMIISILENGLLVPTILACVLLVYGLYILLKEDKQC
ncbi:peptidase M50 [Flavonifractor plautii]|uniref:peptidase M50 n=1 Tax=Flavonifractor plautii TaxID=292800 RepID=UPI0018AA8EBA|nr:peptidase M50 [Flavonifractor plautii]